MQKHLHIISFDIPYPANYGGAIDVFHKIRCLHNVGVKITLHCFQYGNRVASSELEKLCEKVYYYKRNTSIINQFSLLPYNVKSRISSELKQNLLKDKYPILFEVLHTCYLLNDIDLKDRIKLFRHSNIEHDYFNELAKAEKSFLKKIYLRLEAFKLKRFEKTITHANYILSVSEEDLKYFKKQYPNNNSIYLPSFHAFDEIKSKTGKGNYILYHGNLSISENYLAAEWLIKQVFSKIKHPVIIAGLNPPDLLINEINKHAHISLKTNCSESEMNQLISEAHIHCLFTQQTTGLKLKLLNVLFGGRYVLTNPEMLAGTSLKSSVHVCDSDIEFINKINELMEKEFTETEILDRKLKLNIMSNNTKTEGLISLI